MGGTRFVVTGGAQPPAPAGVSLLICNPRCRLDWMYLWCFCARAGICRRLKIALKAPLKQAPLFGWAMQAFHFVFLSRNDRESDLAAMQIGRAHV